MKSKRGFTLIELLVVIAIIGVLAALLFPVLAAAKSRAKRTVCLNNLKQISLGVILYAEEHNNTLPLESHQSATNFWMNYEQLIRGEVGLTGSSSNHAVFICPADAFFYAAAYASTVVPKSAHLQPRFNYSSYGFNAGNIFVAPGRWPGIAGWKTSSIKDAVKTVLVNDLPAYAPFSWHQPQRLPPGLVDGVDKSKNMLSFLDGHVSYVEIYWDEINIATGHEQAWQYDPPAGYDYKWSGN